MPPSEMTDRRDLTTRSLTLRAGSVNEETRSVEAVLTTDQPTRVWDWKRRRIIDEVLLMQGLEPIEQVPLLNTHWRSDLEDVFGSVREIARGAGELLGRLFFSEQGDQIERAWQKVLEGHLTDVSVGYNSRDDGYVDIEPGQTATVQGREYTAGQTVLRVTTRWQLREVSLVPIGADDMAKIRADILGDLPGNSARRDGTMPDELTTNTGAEPPAEGAPPVERAAPPSPPAAPGGGEAAPAVDVQAVQRAAMEQERKRQGYIREQAGPDVDAALVERAVTEGWGEDQVNREFLRSIREARPAPVVAGIHVRDHDRDATAAVLGAGLALRCGIELIDPRASESKRKAQAELCERGDQFRDVSLFDLCRESIRLDGGVVPVGRQEIVQRAASGGTLAYIFTTSAQASLFRGYQEAGDTTDWARETDVANFLQHEAIDPEMTTGLDRLPRGQEASHATVSDIQETYKVGRYAKQFVIDDQDIIDDRMDMFSRVPSEMGAAAARLRPELVYSLLLANPTLGRDSVAVFHADHSNTATNALSGGNLKTGVTAMRKQKRGDKTLNLQPAYLIVASDLDFLALELLQSPQILIALAGTTDASSERGTKNVLQNLVAVRSEARLSNGVTDPSTGTAYAGSATTWFLAASPSQVETVLVAYLTGTGRRPQLRSFVLTEGRWGVGFDIKMDIGAKVLDHIGLYKGNA